MATVYFYFSATAESTTYATAVYNIDCMKLLTDGYCMVMMNGPHPRYSVKMLKYAGGVKWAANPKLVHYTFLVDGKPISTTKAIERTKTASIPTTIV